MVRVDIAFEAIYKAPTLPIAADLPAANGSTVVLRTEIKRACFGSAASTCSLRDKLGARRAAGFPSNVAAYVTAGPLKAATAGAGRALTGMSAAEALCEMRQSEPAIRARMYCCPYYPANNGLLLRKLSLGSESSNAELPSLPSYLQSSTKNHFRLWSICNISRIGGDSFRPR